MRNNFKIISKAIQEDLLTEKCDRIMFYATENTVCRLEGKFKSILILLAVDESTRIRKKRYQKRKYYAIRVKKREGIW